MTLKKLTTLMLSASVLLMQVTPIIAQEENNEVNTPQSVNEATVSEENGSTITDNDVTQSETGSTNDSEPTQPVQESSAPTTSSSPKQESEQSSSNTGSRTPVNSRPSQPTYQSRPSRPSRSYSPSRTFGEVIIPSAPQYSNDPEDFGETIEIEKPKIEVVEPETEEESIESNDTPVEEIEEQKVGLLDGPYVAFNANVFLSEDEADEFIAMIEEDPEAEGRFITNKIINDNDSVIVTVEYAEDIDADGRPILLYVETSFDTEEEALEYGQKYLTIMPDLFFDAEVFELEDQYNVVFGIRHTADTLAFDYDNEDDFEIYYNNERLPFTYQIRADENGEFYDPIPAAVEEAYPGEFTFEETMLSETVKSVTMIPLEETEDSLDESETSEEESDESVNE